MHGDENARDIARRLVQEAVSRADGSISARSDGPPVMDPEPPASDPGPPSPPTDARRMAHRFVLEALAAEAASGQTPPASARPAAATPAKPEPAPEPKTEPQPEPEPEPEATLKPEALDVLDRRIGQLQMESASLAHKAKSGWHAHLALGIVPCAPCRQRAAVRGQGRRCPAVWLCLKLPIMFPPAL